jgi:hypothetical protein
MAAQGRRAIVEGDLREDLDPETVAGSIVGAMFGAQLLSKAMPGGDHIERLLRMWELLLPAIVTDASLPHSREFLAREALRHIQPALGRSDVADRGYGARVRVNQKEECQSKSEAQRSHHHHHRIALAREPRYVIAHVSIDTEMVLAVAFDTTIIEISLWR